MISQRLQPTFSLLVLSVVISISVGIPFGVAAAARRGRPIDKALTYFTTLGFSIPVFVAGYGLAFIFATNLKWLPVQGYAPLSDGIQPFLRILALPAVTPPIVYSPLPRPATPRSLPHVLALAYISFPAA